MHEANPEDTQRVDIVSQWTPVIQKAGSDLTGMQRLGGSSNRDERELEF